MSSPSPPPPPIDAGFHAGDRLDAIPLATIGVMLGLACLTSTLRIYWRMRPTWRIGADDLTLVFSQVSTNRISSRRLDH